MAGREPEIEVSPKHGLNPTMPVCFWCGQEKGEIALMGRIRTPEDDDLEAPRTMLLDYVPCESCTRKMGMGIALVEAQASPVMGDLPPIMGDEAHGDAVYPTGRFAVVSPEGLESMVGPGPLLDAALDKKAAFVEPEVFAMLVPAPDAAEGGPDGD